MADVSVPNWSQVRTQLPTFLRVVIAGLLVGPGISKLLTYERSVRFFASLGTPTPDVWVVVVGLLELLAAGLLLVNRVPRIAALLTIPMMVVAAVTAGPSWQNVGPLVAALGLIALETSSGAPNEAT